MEFFQGTEGLARVVATQPTELISVRSADLRAIVRENPMTGVQLYYGFLTTMVGKHELVTHALVDAKLHASRAPLVDDLRAHLTTLAELSSQADAPPSCRREILSRAVAHIENIIRGLARQAGDRPSLASTDSGSFGTRTPVHLGRVLR